MCKIKRKIAGLIIMMTIIWSISSNAEESELKVTINDKKVEFDEDSGFPFADENQRTLVPIRRDMESAGVKVEWNDDIKSAMLEKDNVSVLVPLDTDYILVNGKKSMMDTTSVSKNGRIYLPIRYVLEAYDYKVEWNQESKTVRIISKDYEAKNEDVKEDDEIIDEDVPEGNTSKDDKKVNENANATVNGEYVNVRTNYSLNSEVVYQVNIEDRVEVLRKLGNWYEIKDGDNKYYIYTTYVTLDEEVKVEEVELEFTMPTADMITSEENKKYKTKVAGTDAWNDRIYELSKQYNVDPIFVKSLMVLESGGDIKAGYPNGSYCGLMQVYKGYGYDLERIYTDGDYAICAGLDIILNKAKSAKLKGNAATCFEIAWRYNSYSEKGLPYANKASSLYEELSGNSRETVVVYN